MRKLISALFVLLILMTSCSTSSLNKENETAKIQVLILDGFSNHDWRATTKALKAILVNYSDFELKVNTVPKKGSDEWKAWQVKFADYDVVIQTCNDIGNGGAWPQAVQGALSDYVSSGGGLLIYHSANNAFPRWPEYNDMIGLGWRSRDFGPALCVKEGLVVQVAAGEGGGTGHGKRRDVLVTRLGEHPIYQGLEKSWLAADLEVYRYARGPAKNLTVLSYAKDLKTQLDFPVEWLVNYGQGRVYNSTYGHYWHDLKEDPAGMRCVAFRTVFRRALLYLAKRPIDKNVPKNFPSKTKISLVK